MPLYCAACVGAWWGVVQQGTVCRQGSGPLVCTLGLRCDPAHLLAGALIRQLAPRYSPLRTRSCLPWLCPLPRPLDLPCRFVVVMHGPEERRTPGNTLVVQPDKPYQVRRARSDPRCAWHAALCCCRRGRCGIPCRLWVQGCPLPRPSHPCLPPGLQPSLPASRTSDCPHRPAPLSALRTLPASVALPPPTRTPALPCNPQGLSQFGNGFLSKFEAAQCDNRLLEEITIVDTPGARAAAGSHPRPCPRCPAAAVACLARVCSLVACNWATYNWAPSRYCVAHIRLACNCMCPPLRAAVLQACCLARSSASSAATTSSRWSAGLRRAATSSCCCSIPTSSTSATSSRR